MTTINWASAVSGNFTDPTKWTGGVVPTASDDAAITASGTYTVTDSGAASVNSLTTVTGVTVDVKSGLFSIGSGTSSIGDSFKATGSGSFAITSATLANSGIIKANDSGASLITDSALTNSGTISETGGGTLTLSGDVITNSSAGKVTASGTNSVVDLSASTIISGGALTSANGGGFLVLDSALLDGQTLDARINGTVAINDSSAAHGQLGISGTIVNKQTVTLEDNGDGNYAELFVNSGSLYGYAASGAATLKGAGSIVLQDNSAGASARITGISDGSRLGEIALTNVDNSISGAGSIGLPGNSGVTSFALDNQAAGTIDANQAHALVIGVTTLTNEGIIEATGGATLALTGGTITNSSTGQITASGTNSRVTLSANTAISGGTLTGSFEVLDAASFSGMTSAVTLNGALVIDDTSSGHAQLGLTGSIVNQGTITLENNGDSNVAELFITNETTLTGGGSIVLQDNAAGASAKIVGPSSGPLTTLTNVDNTISGAGTIGVPGGNSGLAGFTLNNDAAGIIDANQTHALVIAVNNVGNSGLMEATGGGTLTLSGGTIYNSGQITASGANSLVDLSNYAEILGGTLNGSFQVLNTAQLNGESRSVTLNGNISVEDTSSTSGLMGISGAIVNSGTITLEDNGDSNSAELLINNGNLPGVGGLGSATLTGGGSIVLQDNSAGASAKITGIPISGSPLRPITLTNVDNTISGAGSIGIAGSNTGPIGFSLNNQAAGIIDANQAHALVIGVNTLNNSGLLEATNGGTLILSGGTISNSSTSQITASGANSLVDISNAAIISGGTLTGTSGGSFQLLDTGLLYGNTGSITLNSAITIDDTSATHAQLGLSGAIVNKGTITLEDNGDSNYAELFVNNGDVYGLNGGGTATLTGGGSIVLQDNTAGASARITAISSTPSTPITLTNVDNIISGAGSIGLPGNSGVSNFILTNQAAGIIDANQAHALEINVSTLSNSGLIEATSSGGLTIEASSFLNTGTITANGGNILVSGAVSGAGHASIGGSSILEFGAASTANTTFLAGSSGTLQLDNSAGFTGTITGFAASNALDLRDFSSAGASVSYTSGTGLLIVTNASTHVSYHMALVGVSAFQVIDDGHGGTSVISA